MKQRVIIIGQGFTGRLSLTRSVAQLGCEVTLIALTGYKEDGKTLRTKKPIDASSKYVKDYYFCYVFDEEGLVQILLNHCIDEHQKSIIIPDNDFSAAIIDKHKDILSDKFLFPRIINKDVSVQDWMDKTKQKKTACEVGLNVVNYKLVELHNGAFQIPSGINYPCFVKPMVSIVGGKSGIKRCDDEQALKNHINTVKEKYKNAKLLLEDYINIETEYAVLGYANGTNVFIPGILKILTLAHGKHMGVAIQGEIMPIDGYEDLVKRFEEFVARIGFNGIFDIDFFYSKGVYFLGELNLRFGGSGYAYTRMGVNLPAIMVKDLRGEDYSSLLTNVKESAVYVNERMLTDEWEDDYITIPQCKQMLNTSDIRFVYDKNDKKPQQVFIFRFFIRRVKKSIKRCLGIHQKK